MARRPCSLHLPASKMVSQAWKSQEIPQKYKSQSARVKKPLFCGFDLLETFDTDIFVWCSQHFLAPHVCASNSVQKIQKSRGGYTFLLIRLIVVEGDPSVNQPVVNPSRCIIASNVPAVSRNKSTLLSRSSSPQGEAICQSFWANHQEFL